MKCGNLLHDAVMGLHFIHLETEFSSQEEKYEKKAHMLKDELSNMFVDVRDPLSDLELVDCILKLGLASYFEEEIRNILNTISSAENLGSSMEKNLYATALCFRLLRQHGYEASEGICLICCQTYTTNKYLNFESSQILSKEICFYVLLCLETKAMVVTLPSCK